MAEYTFDLDGPGGDAWNNAYDWYNITDGKGDDGIPGAGDDVIIDFSINTNGGQTVENATVNNGTVTGNLNVTDLLDAGDMVGGAVSAGTFQGGEFEGTTLSAGLIDGDAYLETGTVTCDDAAEIVVMGSTVSAGTMSATDPADFPFYLQLDSGSLSAGSLDMDTSDGGGGVTGAVSMVVSGGTLTVGGASKMTGNPTSVTSAVIAGGETHFDSVLMLSDNVELDNGSGGAGGVFSADDLTVGETGSAMVNLSAGQTSVTHDLILGKDGDGELTVADGAKLVIGGDLDIASASTGSGSAHIVGDGAEVTVRGDAQVGISGSGRMSIEDGAKPMVSGGFEIGVGSGGAGVVVVSGSDTELTIGGAGLTVGAEGSGVMTLEAGAAVDAGGADVTVGESATGAGTLSVSGSDTTLSAATLTVGDGAHAATLTISDGGAVTVNGDLSVGDAAGGKGALSAVDAGTTLDIGGQSVVGGAGQGALSFTGADVTLADGLTLGESAGGQGSLTMAGGTIDLTGDLAIGEAGQGSVTVADGAKVGAGATVADVTLGGSTGAKGSLAVTGAGSVIESDGLTVGEGGTATLSVTKDGEVLTRGDAAVGDTALGREQKASVTSGATWSVGDSLTVGGGGIGEVTVETGGRLLAAGGVVLGEQAGATGFLTVEGETGGSAALLSWGGALEVGDKGTGELRVAAGGTAAGVTLDLGGEAGAFGSATVTGSGAVLRVSELVVGGQAGAPGGHGALILGSGADVVVGAATVEKSGGIVDLGGAAHLGAMINEALIDVAEGSVTVAGAMAGTGAVTVGSAASFTLDAAGTKTANRARLSTAPGRFSLTGGSGADVFEMTAADLKAGDVIAGGAGNDTLVFTTAGAIAAAAFADVTGVDTLMLAKGDNALTLSEALVAGSDAKRLTIGGGTGSDTVNASAVTTGAVVFDGAATARTVFTAGAGVTSVTGGSGADVFRFAAADLTSADRVVGGGGDDVLQFTTAGAIAAAAFEHVTGIDEIQLANGLNVVDLGPVLASRADSGVLTVEGGTGNDHIDAAEVSSTTTFVFDGHGGGDVVRGGKGDNVYEAGGSGTLAVTNAVTGGAAAHGELAFAAGITDQDLWLVRSGSSLVVDVIGTKASVTLSGWYAANASAKVKEITAGGYELDAGVQKLVAAMAAYQTAHPSFDPTAAGAVMPTAAAVQSAIAANWHK